MNTKENLLQLKKELISNKKDRLIKVPFLLLFLAALNSNTKSPLVNETYASMSEENLDNSYQNDLLMSNSMDSVSLNEEECYQEVGPASMSEATFVPTQEEVEEEDLSMTDKRFMVLQHYQMSESDLTSFVNAIMLESAKSGERLEEEQIISTLYDLADVPNDVKIDYILRTRRITLDEFYKTGAVVLAESYNDGNSYIDSYGVTSTLANREISGQWAECGSNIYLQAHARGQYIVVNNGRANRFRGRTDTIGFQAYIDCLYMGSRLPMHGYTSFRSWKKKAAGRVAYVYGGNNYFGEISYDERIRRAALNTSVQMFSFDNDLEVEFKDEPILSLSLK